VVAGWNAVAAELTNQGQLQLAHAVTRFVEWMPQPATERAQIAEQLDQQLRHDRARELHLAR
jgi:hypothetical protein